MSSSYPPRPHDHYKQSPGPGAPPPSGGGKAWIIVLAVIGSLTILTVACCGGGIYLVQFTVAKVEETAEQISETVQTFPAQFAATELRMKIGASHFTPAEKRAMNNEVNRVDRALRTSNGIDPAQATAIYHQISDSPVFQVNAIRLVEQKYLAGAALPPQEKTDAERTLQRASRGLLDGSIQPFRFDSLTDQHLIAGGRPPAATDAEPYPGDCSIPGQDAEAAENRPVGQPIASRDALDGVLVKESLTDEELRVYLAAVKQLCDDAGVPDEPYQADIAAELKKIVDAELN